MNRPVRLAAARAPTLARYACSLFRDSKSAIRLSLVCDYAFSITT